MPKFSIKIPSHASAKIAAKVKAKVEEALADAQPKIAALIVDRITQEADKELHSQAPVYKRAVQDPEAIELTQTGVKITLHDPVAKALETGIESFDIKTAMLAHAKKFDKQGRPIVDVPFSHRPYSRHQTNDIDRMPKNVLRSLEKKTATFVKKNPGADVHVRSNAKGAAPRAFDRELVSGGKTFNTKVQHKVGIHDNMIYRRPAGGGAGTYNTIRRISRNSAATSWWHPGFRGLGIFKKVMAQLKPDLNRILGDSFRAVGLKARFK